MLDSGYKANRADYSKADDEENPYSQLPYIYKSLQYLDIAYAETESCEADDWISSYVKLYGDDNEIVISSFDSDFFQLLSGNVSVFRYRGDKSVVCTSEYLKEKYGISPCQYADFKSLTGDKADNIAGAEKIGVKTASALLQEFGTLENIIHNAEMIKKRCVRESVIKNRERLLCNLKLIKLDGKNAVPFKLDEMAFTDKGITTTEVLRGIGLK
ncbi:MAG: flap endonuclease [Oscillospiraceae bacterium]|nr:flap endonuclease [Oscillospiraceae bacterium]